MPVKVTLEANKEYYFCRCGKGEKGVFCNGSHKGTEFTPLPFKTEKAGEYYLCGCKKSANQPYCDGSHAQ